MNRGKFVLLFLLTLCLVVLTGMSALAANTTDIPMKQIAAPPSEFADLQLPQPIEAGTRSQSAMIPVDLQPDGNGSLVWEGNLRIDNGSEAAIMVFAPEVGLWTVALETGADSVIELDEQTRRADVTRQVTDLSLGNTAYTGEVYRFTQLAEGVLPVRVTAVASDLAPNAAVDGYLLVAAKQSRYQLFAHVNTHNLLVGNQVGLVAYMYDNSELSRVDVPQPVAGLIQDATMYLSRPDGQKVQVAMFDDGQHADGLAGDGVFGALVTADMAGDYIGQVVVSGLTLEERPFMRSSEHLFPIIEADLDLSSNLARVVVNDERLQINLLATGTAVDKVQVAAEVWGTDAYGQDVPVAWIGGLVEPNVKGNRLALPLSLDARWIGMAQAVAPFELRNVRVQDVNTHIPMAQANEIALATFRLPAVARQAITEVTEEMLMGVRPATMETRAPNAGKLLLVHGYCSGGVWPTGDFSSYSVFQDYNQNRSHDQFAQLIGSHGSQFSSFGVVAHSQGGAASLHLYTYYWSGLDYASGSRLVQSVGTPYQGTSLAGNLALLGEIFGIGCGSNTDLTYNGASLWLSGIPSWARGEIHYATTSFTDKWWRYDYCHFGSDLLLSDPDDGTTEKWSGQLSGANNMGHKTGWCHTNGMRDPAQYNDHGRNANMNSNAAR